MKEAYFSLNTPFIDEDAEELVVSGFTWTDYHNRIHIHLPTLKEALNSVGLTIIEIDYE